MYAFCFLSYVRINETESHQATVLYWTEINDEKSDEFSTPLILKTSYKFRLGTEQ